MNLDVLRGMLYTLALYSLYTDYLGLEGYIARVRETWVDPLHSVPIAIGTLILAVTSERKSQ